MVGMELFSEYLYGISYGIPCRKFLKNIEEDNCRTNNERNFGINPEKKKTVKSEKQNSGSIGSQKFQKEHLQNSPNNAEKNCSKLSQ